MHTYISNYSHIINDETDLINYPITGCDLKASKYNLRIKSKVDCYVIYTRLRGSALI